MGLSDVRFDGGTRISGMTATSPCALEYNAIYLKQKVYLLDKCKFNIYLNYILNKLTMINL